MNFSTYRAIPALNWSLLKHAATSPRHFRYWKTHTRPDTPQMALGRAVHTAVLEPDSFPLGYVVWDGARRGKDWIEFRDVNTAAGREILNADEYAKCLAIRDAVRSHPVAARILEGAATEVTLQWTDEKTGLACKARADILNGGTLGDLKTARTIDEREFAANAYRLGYFGQAAFYASGAEAVFGERPDGCCFIAVESDPPHDVAVYEIDDDSLYCAENEVRQLLNLVADCERTGKWPGRYEQRQILRAPAWAYPSEDEMDELIAQGLAPARGDK